MNTLCQAVVTTATRCPALKSKAEYIKNTFIKVFNSFADCRKLYDTSKMLDDRDIALLGMVEWICGVGVICCLLQKPGLTGSWICTGTSFLKQPLPLNFICLKII